MILVNLKKKGSIFIFIDQFYGLLSNLILIIFYGFTDWQVTIVNYVLYSDTVKLRRISFSQ